MRQQEVEQFLTSVNGARDNSSTSMSCPPCVSNTMLRHIPRASLSILASYERATQIVNNFSVVQAWETQRVGHVPKCKD